jgi:hypothetical protein
VHKIRGRNGGGLRSDLGFGTNTLIYSKGDEEALNGPLSFGKISGQDGK